MYVCGEFSQCLRFLMFCFIYQFVQALSSRQDVLQMRLDELQLENEELRRDCGELRNYILGTM